jgi:hypothetical protein
MCLASVAVRKKANSIRLPMQGAQQSKQLINCQAPMKGRELCELVWLICHQAFLCLYLVIVKQFLLAAISVMRVAAANGSFA